MKKTKKVAVACKICKAMCKVSKLAVNFSGKVEFCQDGENTWADISDEALVELIDIEGLSFES